MSGVADRRVVVFCFCVALEGAGELYFATDDGVSPTALTGTIELLADSPVSSTFEGGLFSTAAGDDLNLESTAAANGFVVYALL